MSAPREIEIKFRISDLKKLARALKRNGFREVTPFTLERNVLYDLAGEKLRKRGDLLRLRQYGDKWTLTHKSKSTNGRHKVRVERETVVENGRQLSDILLALKFSPTFRYEKFRAEWSDGKGHVVLDKTPIGDFGEIEGPSRWIDRTAKALGVAREHYIIQTYAPMFFDWKRRTGSPAVDMTFRAVGKKHS